MNDPQILRNLYAKGQRLSFVLWRVREKVDELLRFEQLYESRTKKDRREIAGNSCILTTQEERDGAVC